VGRIMRGCDHPARIVTLRKALWCVALRSVCPDEDRHPACPEGGVLVCRLLRISLAGTCREASSTNPKADPSLRPAPAQTAGNTKARGTARGMTALVWAKEARSSGQRRVEGARRAARFAVPNSKPLGGAFHGGRSELRPERAASSRRTPHEITLERPFAQRLGNLAVTSPLPPTLSSRAQSRALAFPASFAGAGRREGSAVVFLFRFDQAWILEKALSFRRALPGCRFSCRCARLLA
jgi:hypothetical protein